MGRGERHMSLVSYRQRPIQSRGTHLKQPCYLALGLTFSNQFLGVSNLLPGKSAGTTQQAATGFGGG